MKWIEIKDGCEMPNYDEQVLWLAEDGNCFVDALDKDGNPWLYEHESEGFKFPKVTHWTRFTLPDESRHPAEQGDAIEALKILQPYIEDLQMDNHNEPSAGIFYDHKLESGLRLMYKCLGIETWPPKHQPSGSEPTAGELYRPTIVCLCGSTRFMDAFIKANRDETISGKIVLSVGTYGHMEGMDMNSQMKKNLDELHKRKIDLADEVFILNVGGYIGESTRNELNYAIEKGKPVKYLESPTH